MRHSGRLFQQYLVDQFARIDEERLSYLRGNQAKIRADLYSNLEDHVERNDSERIGTRTVLPSSYIGGPRNMSANYQDSMAIVRKFGKPDLFVTMTCNPKWYEIQAELLPHQKAEDRPDLVARIFKLKLEQLYHDIKKGVLGKIVAMVYTIEYQKRGLPHAHIIVILADKADVLSFPDKYTCAELPDPTESPILYEYVGKHMMHGPCGAANSRSPCMKDGVCSKDFPKEYVYEISH